MTYRNDIQTDWDCHIAYIPKADRFYSIQTNHVVSCSKVEEYTKGSIKAENLARNMNKHNIDTQYLTESIPPSMERLSYFIHKAPNSYVSLIYHYELQKD